MKNRRFHIHKFTLPTALNRALTAAEKTSLKQLALDEIPAVIERLVQEIPGAVQSFCIKEWLEKWINQAWADAYQMRGGLLWMALDHYYENRRAPEQEVWQQMPESKKLHQYLWDRNLDAFGGQVEHMLYEIAVRYLIPETIAWHSKEALEKTIHQQLKAVKEVIVESVELDLKEAVVTVHRPELKAQANWQELQCRLDEHGAWPITLLDKSLDIFRQKTVIVTSYKQLSKQVFSLAIYDYENSGAESSLILDIGQNTFTLKSQQYEGWFCESYQKQCPPVIKRDSYFIWKLIKLIWRLLKTLLKKLKNQNHGKGSI